jgi:hypothetical protein
LKEFLPKGRNTMKVFIIILAVLFFVFLIVRGVRKYRDMDERRPDIIQHPSAFKKPDIEMVNKPIEREDKDDQVFEIKTSGKKS